MYKFARFSALAVVLITNILVGCSPPEGNARGTTSEGKLQIVATTGMIADLVREIAGERAEVVGLMGPGVDPHTYRQTRSDIAAMASADVVFWHGLYLEAQLEDFFIGLAKEKTVIAVAENLDRAELLSHETYPNRFDPHVWMVPRIWKSVAVNVRESLISIDSANADLYRANTDAYLVKLDSLSAYATRILASVPEDQRVLVTAHDAFRYFGREYGFEVLGIQGISTDSEASLKRIEDIVGTLVSRRIGAIFVESSVSDRNVMALVEGARSRQHRVVIGGELFSDAMGAPGTYEGTYLGMIDHNVTIIARALGGSVPKGGFSGRLKCC